MVVILLAISDLSEVGCVTDIMFYIAKIYADLTKS
jgi:hypothetical protein